MDSLQLLRALRQHIEGWRAAGVSSWPRHAASLHPVPQEALCVNTGRNVPGARSGLSEATAVKPWDGVHSIVAPAIEQPRALTEKARRLAEITRQAEACRRCPLYQTRTHVVVGDGAPQAELVFVGEAPGRDEDLQGKPFVGAAGRLLNKMIEAMGLTRESVYICNVLKDRPPGNRAPLPEEVEACLPFLRQQLDILQPTVICTLGAVSTKALLGPHISIMKIRGEVRDYQGTRLVPTFHPAYLLRNPDAKRLAWADLKTVKRLLSAQIKGS